MEVSSESSRNEDDGTSQDSINDMASDSSFYGIAEEFIQVNEHMKDKGIDWIQVDEALSSRPSFKYVSARVPVPDSCDLSEPFTHEPLTEPTTIRLLLLHSGFWWDPLEGSLVHESLGPMIGYEPLSYAWGEDSTPCSILLNGRQMSITQSLFDALRRMRHHDRDRMVWADGVCINQADDAEKSIQVSLMPEIFNQARVWAYLGEAADDSEIVPEFLEQLSHVGDDNFSKQSSMAHDLPPANDRKWQALFAFLSRPWFRRLWVIQEVVIAREVRFLCGNREIGWRVLLHTAELVDKCVAIFAKSFDAKVLQQAVSAQESAVSLGMMLSLHLRRSHAAGRLEDLRRRMEGRRSDNFVNLDAECARKRDAIVEACRQNPRLLGLVESSVRFLPIGLKPAHTPILKLFMMFIHSEAKLPQDRLYVLTGLAGDVNVNEFPPNYGETVEEANLRFSRILIEKGQGMDVLFHATRLVVDISSNPSWTPDWTTRRNFDNHWLKLGWAYKEGFPAREAGSLVTLFNAHVLRVSGHQLDRCQAVSIAFPLSVNRNWISQGDWLSTFIRQTNAMFSGADYFTGESWSAVWTRTLVADDNSAMDNVIANLVEDMRSLDDQETVRFDPYFRNFKLTCGLLFTAVRKWSGYSVCKTSKGYVGIVPNLTTATDEIFMLKGSNMPFVLRSIQDRPGHYTFVGGCYMHGLMEGEAWKLDHADTELFLV